jgi:alpha-glucosidase
MATLARMFLAIAVLWGSHAVAQQPPASVTPLRDGVELQRADTNIVLRVTAPRDDILRVRIAIARLPEDASWAVLPAALHAGVAVAPAQDPKLPGFSTHELSVTMDPSSLQSTVRDSHGEIILRDAPQRRTELRPDGSFTVWQQMPADAHYFGLGDKAGPLDHRGQAYTLWNTDAYGWQATTDPLYKSVPFFMGFAHGRAYGIFLDNTWRTNFDFGKADRNALSFSAEGGPLDYYILAGPTPKDVLRQYAFLTGTAPLPPRWAFGYQQSRWSYSPESKVREIANRLRADKIPADVLWLDIDYQDRNRPFTVDKQRFPDMPKLIADLRAQNFHVVAITDPHIAYTPDDPTYAPYQSGMAQGSASGPSNISHFPIDADSRKTRHPERFSAKDPSPLSNVTHDAFAHNPDGSLFVGKVWPGASVFPDFTREKVRDWWGSLYQQFASWGIAGFWNDMNEPSVFDGPNKTMPLDTVHRIEDAGFVTRTATHREVHNIYGMENTRATYEGLLKIAPGERPFVMTRASFAGGQRYAVTWTGDNSSTWEHLRQTTPQLENLGLSGFAFSGADVGGFAGSPPPDLLEKWLEISAFQPIDRDHTQKDTRDQEPWANGSQREAVDRKFIETRYKLLPYIYTAAEETSRTGVPMLRPLFVEFPHATPDGHPLDLDAPNEFLLGADLLVAPAPFPEQPDAYPLVLPPGGWYDFWTARKVDESLKIAPRLDHVPVFVRAGAIVPMQPLTQSTIETPQSPLELRVYPGPDCTGSLYWDDGHTLNYQRGEFLRQQFTCEADEDALRVRLGKRDGNFAPWWQQIDIAIAGVKNSAVTVTNAKGTTLASHWDAETQTLHVIVPADAIGGEVRVQLR